MTENLLRYNYDITVKERYYMTNDEALLVVKDEQEKAQAKNHALILTGKGNENKSFFDAVTAQELSHNFTWIHFCPQKILKFDDKKTQEGNYYVLVMEGIVKNIII